eukprot:scaffold901_cov167-Alexandrium_tamarense.AAC.3
MAVDVGWYTRWRGDVRDRPQWSDINRRFSRGAKVPSFVAERLSAAGVEKVRDPSTWDSANGERQHLR